MSLNSFPSLKPKENSFFFPIFVSKQLEKKKNYFQSLGMKK